MTTKGVTTDHPPPLYTESETPDEVVQQDGVQIADAVTTTWSRKHLIIAYTSMWLVYFVNNLNSSLTLNLSAYITSDFSEHSLLTVITVVTSVMGASCLMPIAKVLNLFDRTVGFVIMILIAIMGLIMMAACKNIATYCAAQSFYTVGLTGAIFCIDVITSDTSSLRDRGLAFALTSSPSMITAFAGSPLSNQFHETNWRWAYGTICIILPIAALPLIVTWEMAKRKADKAGQLHYKQKTQRSWKESIRYYVMEFDVIGIFLMIGGTILFLTSFNIAGNTEGQWQSPKIIAMMVVGFCVLVAFVAYERWLAPKPFIPFHLITDRTVIGACLLDITYQVSYYCWASYFTSYLQVVYNTSLTQAGYISAIFDFMDPVWLIGCGFLIRVTGRFKWLLCCALPLYLLASGLMIYFRSPGHSVGYMCMCQIFLAVGGGTFILIEQVAVLAAASHEDYAAMLALLSTFGNIGGAVGSSVSGAIWTNTLPVKLRDYLPAELKDQWADIYESLEIQLSYPVGSPGRIAIQNAYAFSQRYMMIAGTAVMGLSIAWVLMMRNIKVQSNKDLSKVLF
ncbi:Major facilitator superfamily domain general substrate transporter [Penicillium cf. griseofulvum]|uniref:Major facilitator superfamily domain general substrate transporter n=1 Tax=Penicillium cf. griseofulvum TaxID=2972120 RepID=A0A9W9MPX7_9EURO|nr:Major facilitator superfamily domain general substrate transporter [Penicillium cf. griseofulvum]KAJ5437528.1 Major facilitator superfamily domain general substrate transporter [Penicillium cf. griseofulvum]KAJ5441672.1 Major facilitator superfamily domain general substrate transporter [Penicillium cf. griseofulvum]